MKNLNQYFNQSIVNESKLDEEIKEWERRFQEPFGQALKELQWLINDLGLYEAEKTEFGFYTFTPFDNYVTSYALHGNKQYTYSHVKDICDDWDFSTHPKVKRVLKKIENLTK
jgi:hypothetical protein